MSKKKFFKSGQIYMKDAQCAESNENQFSDFYFSSYREQFIENWGIKMTITQ